LLLLLASGALAKDYYCETECVEERQIWVWSTPECDGLWYDDACTCPCHADDPVEGQPCGILTTTTTNATTRATADTGTPAVCVFAAIECLREECIPGTERCHCASGPSGSLVGLLPLLVAVRRRRG